MSLPSAPIAGLPARPLLRPGVRVTRRDDDHLQVGLHPSIAVVAPDRPEVRSFLDSLTAGQEPTVSASPPVQRLCSELIQRGLVVDGVALLRALHTSSVRPQAVAAIFAEQGDAGEESLARRRSSPVAVTGPAFAVDAARELLEASGVVSTGSTTEDGAAAALLIHVGEPSRDEVDELVRHGVPHLLLTVTEGLVRLGPFVDVGRTACLRCVDAHHGDRDPRRSLIIQQYAASRSGARADMVPEPVDPASFAAALALAVRDLVTYVDGDEPATWSSTIEVDRRMAMERTRWSRHPGCGCSWAGGLVWGHTAV